MKSIAKQTPETGVSGHCIISLMTTYGKHTQLNLEKVVAFSPEQVRQVCLLLFNIVLAAIKQDR